MTAFILLCFFSIFSRLPRNVMYIIFILIGKCVLKVFVVTMVSKPPEQKDDASSVLVSISPETNHRAAKTNSCWWLASFLRSLWPASRQQPRDPQHSEGGAEESSGPPTSYKTRGRRKHSDNRHTWSKEAGTEKDLEREANREQETVQLLPQTGSSSLPLGLTQTNIETKDQERGLKKKRRTKSATIWLERIILHFFLRIYRTKNWHLVCEVIFV